MSGFYKKLILKKDRDRALEMFHPWIFSGAVKTLPDAANGSIVNVCSEDGTLLGSGFYSDKSQIVCRLFDFSGFSGEFSTSFFKEKILRAYELRKKLIKAGTDCFRLFHSEGDFLPGLIVDIYGNTAVLQVLVVGMELILPIVTETLNELGFNNIYVKNPDNILQKEGVKVEGVISGSVPDNLVVLENNLKFSIDIKNGQKTGFFIDQRDNRQLVRDFSSGRNVLNAFSYTGGFSVYAMAGGASSVTSLDISADAVDLSRANLSLNGFDKNVEFVKEDCFKYLREMEKGRYDLIILDPPAFAKNKNAVNQATRGYKDINLAAFKKAAPGALMFTYSCSQHIDKDLFRKVVFGAARDSGRNVRVIKQLSQSGDHPINIYHPEGEYLKGLMLHIE